MGNAVAEQEYTIKQLNDEFGEDKVKGFANRMARVQRKIAKRRAERAMATGLASATLADPEKRKKFEAWAKSEGIKPTVKKTKAV